MRRLLEIMSAYPTRAVSPLCGASALSQTVVPGLWSRGRGVRVMLLASLVLAMSAADLYITLLYLGSTGMAEENPIARLVMSHGSAGFLASWKLFTVMPALTLMVAYRRRVVIELLGWVACAVLVTVMVRWMQYADETDLILVALHALEDGVDHRWVTMAPAS